VVGEVSADRPPATGRAALRGGTSGHLSGQCLIPFATRRDSKCLGQATTIAHAAGLPIQIVIDAYFDLTPAAVADLESVQRSLAQYDIGLRWNDGLVLD